MPVLELRDITKVFPGVRANDRVSLTLERGEIVALLGENGAGKSTLMNVAYGLLSADGGEILVDGVPARIRSPRDAIALGIGMVHQHFMLVEPLTVTENIILGHEPARFGILDRKGARKKVEALSQQYGLKVDPDAHVRDLSVGMQQRVEILKALYQGARILILDEPTAVLTPQEVRELFAVIRSLVDAGLSVVLITHKLDEVMGVADRIVVMRDGRVVGETTPKRTDQIGLARMMVGRDVVLRVDRSQASAEDGRSERDVAVSEVPRTADYVAILRRAWEITWRHRTLWVFGLLAGPAWAPMAPFLPGWGAAAVVGLLAYLAMLASTGGLVFLAHQAEEGTEAQPGAGWRAGFGMMWRVTGIRVLSGLAISVPFAVVGFVLAVLQSTPASWWGLALFATFMVCSALAVGTLAVLTAVGELGVRYAVIEDRTVRESLLQGWQDVRSRQGAIVILVWQILIATALLVFAAGLGLLVVGQPFGVSAVSVLAGQPAYAVFAVLLLIPAGIYSAFASNIWTDFFRQMTRHFADSEVTGQVAGREGPRALVGETVLRVTDLCVKGQRGLESLKGISLDVRAGEIVGIAGVDGNGQTELIEAIVGLRRASGGTIALRDHDITRASTRKTIEAGVSHVPEDRHRRGLVLEFDLAENLILGDHGRMPFATMGLTRPGAISVTARKRIEDYDIRTPSEHVLAGALSGGNQQKVVLARELGREPEMLVAAQPTRGLDVGAIEFVHRRLIAERDSGTAILLVSMELEEVISLSDRILVMYGGHVVAEFAASEADAERIGYYMTGGKPPATKAEPVAAVGGAL
jgi:ABC-type uncharacterized transport system ATPase subunit